MASAPQDAPVTALDRAKLWIASLGAPDGLIDPEDLVIDPNQAAADRLGFSNVLRGSNIGRSQGRLVCPDPDCSASFDGDTAQLAMQDLSKHFRKEHPRVDCPHPQCKRQPLRNYLLSHFQTYHPRGVDVLIPPTDPPELWMLEETSSGSGHYRCSGGENCKKTFRNTDSLQEHWRETHGLNSSLPQQPLDTQSLSLPP
ncbi:hypothetical protein BKA70DRAFT_1267783 [Coprinopsis sp. MPI-PUGE-AT-0042]|nr:hypothetical protein BKA70DRAFT_1267783 [Coprinopsis sp. MPI-PUGE-AT-0042]